MKAKRIVSAIKIFTNVVLIMFISAVIIFSFIFYPIKFSARGKVISSAKTVVFAGSADVDIMTKIKKAEKVYLIINNSSYEGTVSSVSANNSDNKLTDINIEFLSSNVANKVSLNTVQAATIVTGQKKRLISMVVGYIFSIKN